MSTCYSDLNELVDEFSNTANLEKPSLHKLPIQDLLRNIMKPIRKKNISQIQTADGAFFDEMCSRTYYASLGEEILKIMYEVVSEDA